MIAVYGLFGVVGTYLGARPGDVTPVVIQPGLFALVMAVAAWKRLKPPRQHMSAVDAVSGGGEGLLIGPAQVLLSGLPMRQAVGIHGPS